MKKRFSLFLLIAVLTLNPSYGQIIKTAPPVPSTHPRVLVKPKDILDLKKKRNLPEFKLLWIQIESSNEPICQALTYLLDGDAVKGKAAINGAYNALTKCTSQGLRFMNEVFLGACVYDWCYDLMTSAQKQKFIAEFARIHNLHTPYWPARDVYDAIVSHNSSGWFFNQLFAGLAIYNENPLIWNEATRIFFQNYQEVRNFAFQSHMSHQGWYTSTRWCHVLMTGFLFKTLSDGKNVWTSDFEKTGEMLLYFMRPDQQIMRMGDVSDDTWGHEFNNVYINGLADYYRNPYFAYLGGQKTFRSYDQLRDDLFVKFLLRPIGLEHKNQSDLPLTKYFAEPVGAQMVARTGWDMQGPLSRNAVIDMRIGQYFFGGHQHKDFGTFQIYYKGNLTGDSGMYGGSKSDFDSDHWRHYYRSTTAHNGIIIYDPAETYGGGKWSKTTVDGGVRWPYNHDIQPDFITDILNPKNGFEMGKVIAHEFGPDQRNPEFSYLSGDLTPGYTGKAGTGYTTRAKKITRSMITFNTANPTYPAVFVVFDRVEVTNKDFRKSFLLHSIKKPQISENKAVIKRGDGLSGKLVSYTLFPANPVINTVEGFKIGGQNYDPGTKGGKYEDMRWRMEVSPKDKTIENYFMHAMIVMDEPTAEPVAEAIESGNLMGAKVLDQIAMFSKDGTLISQAEFDVEGESDLFKILLCDVAPGKWKIFVDGIEKGEQIASINGQTLYFEAKPGRIKLVHDPEALTKVP